MEPPTSREQMQALRMLEALESATEGQSPISTIVRKSRLQVGRSAAFPKCRCGRFRRLKASSMSGNREKS